MSDTTNVVYAHTFSELLDLAAMELSQIIVSSIGEELRNPDAPLFQSLLKAGPTDFPQPVPNHDRIWLAACSFAGRPEFKNLSADIAVRFSEAVPLSTTLVDPWEKRLRLEISLGLAMGKTSWRTLRKIYRMEYPAKIQRLAFPLLAKFTLLVREPDRTDLDNEGYNRFENTIDGRPTSTNGFRPLVFFHRSVLQQVDVQQAGWVALGGTRELQMHLSSGGDPLFGEFFQFCTLGTKSNRPPLFMLQNLPATPAFQGVFPLPATPPLSSRLAIQGALFGFYAVDNSDPPQDMNYNNTLERFFPSPTSRTMRSSILHLSGSLANPSPTRVFGPLKRVFSQYSSVVLDLEPTDGRTDGVLAMLKNPAEFRSAAGGGGGDFWSSVPAPSYCRLIGRPDPIELASFTLQDLFGTVPTYRNLCSKLVLEDYNRVYDYLQDPSLTIPPAPLYATRFREVTHRADEVRMKNEFDGRTFGPIDLTKLTGTTLIENRVSLAVDSFRDLDSSFLTANTLNPRGQVLFVRHGPLVLPRGLTVTTSGVLAVAGDVRIEGGLTCAPNACLTVVSVGGNLEITTTNEEIQASLIALDGSLRLRGTHPVRIRGSLAVKELHPEEVKPGGEITYDERGDPLQDQDHRTYAFHLADYADRWEIRTK